MLTGAEHEFLRRIATGERLGLADRAADKVRQKMRRQGFAEVVQNPRRWVLTEKGAQALATTNGETSHGND